MAHQTRVRNTSRETLAGLQRNRKLRGLQLPIAEPETLGAAFLPPKRPCGCCVLTLLRRIVHAFPVHKLDWTVHKSSNDSNEGKNSLTGLTPAGYWL